MEQGGGRGADGGVDIRLYKGGKCTLVQCKHWKTYKVGVNIVRELLGVVTHERAHAGIVVCSGVYTEEAVRLAGSAGIRLIDGSALTQMIHSVQKNPPTPIVVPQQPAPAVQQVPVREQQSTPSCPLCQAAMTLRTAKKGANAGSSFWGCSTYPQCRGTRPAT